MNGARTLLADNQGFGEQLHDFLRAIRHRNPTRIDAVEIVPTMEVLDVIRDTLFKLKDGDIERPSPPVHAQVS